ncbi:MAG: hypothetical protein ACQETR_15625 [Thermodesulfobacteriota bacterium]
MSDKTEKLIRWFKQPSTIRALTILGSVLGFTITPEIALVGAAIIGLYELLRDEDKQIKESCEK